MKHNKPTIRFKGFEEEWVEKKAIELCSISTGKSNTQDNIKDGQYPFYVRSATIERSNRFLFDEEAVLTVGDGVGTGKVYHYVNGKYDLHQRVYRMFDFKEVIGKYFYLFFSNNFQERVTSMTAKSSVDSVRLEMISEMSIKFPILTEQHQIGTFFQNLDTLITQHQQKHSKLQALKKAMLAKMFPKQGQTTPEIRFKGFSGDWEEKPFNELCWYQEGPGLRHWQFTKQGIKVINVTNLENGVLNLSRTDRYISNEEFIKIYKHFEIDPNDIVVASSGNSYGKVAVVREQDLPLLMNTSVIRFKPLKELNYDYLFTFLKSDFFKNQIDLLITGGAQPNFGPAHLNKVKINVPKTIEEQQQIGNYFKNLDSLITHHQTQILKLQHIKKGFLGKMFV